MPFRCRLIRRFIDPEAQIVYVDPHEVLATAAVVGGLSFDAPGATYTHRPAASGAGERCTFETLIAEFGLGADSALVELGRIVHAADVTGELGTHLLGPGLLATGVGGLAVESDDQVLLARAAFIYDALYAYCQHQVANATR